MPVEEPDPRFETTDPSKVLASISRKSVQDAKEKVRVDEFMSHFMNQTWKIQGPDFEYNTLTNMHRVTKETMFTALPKIDTDTAVIVGAGPSLQKNVHLLAEIPKDWIVICTDRALKECLKYREPYIVANLEATIEVLQDVQEWWKDIPTERLRMVTVPFADPAIFDLWNGQTYFINPLQTSRQMLRLSGKMQWKTGVPPMTTGSNVGVMSIVIAANLLKMKDVNSDRTKWKNIVLIGFDHVFYQDSREVNLNVNDINGTDCFVPWNFFVGQFEIRFFAEEFRNRGIRLVNCTEAGIAYSPNIYRSTFEQFIKRGVDGEPSSTYPAPADTLKSTP